MACSSLSFY
jgi:hypothetical protein